jgi:nicotinate-nucleotide pyrophosphorylase (carboxylating)
MTDIRDEIFKAITRRQVMAKITAQADGILSGAAAAKKEAETLGLKILDWLEDGIPITAGDQIAAFAGTPKQIAAAEDVLMGHMAKPSGIATAAKQFVDNAGTRQKIVSGSWKKMPLQIKEAIRTAVATGGAAIRISDAPFVYLDKNYIRILGGIRESLLAAAGMNGRKRVIQIHGYFMEIASEALEAAENGADIIFIDTGSVRDVRAVLRILEENNLRKRVRIAFAGGIRLADLDRLKLLDIDILDIGKAIVDAPLLDMRMEVANPA